MLKIAKLHKILCETSDKIEFVTLIGQRCCYIVISGIVLKE